ncbi:MAG: septum formation initiator family protein [Melioribacteraceae bacterium]
MTLNRKILFRIISILGIAVILLFLFFNENGILKYLKLKNEVKKLNEEILKAEERLRALDSEIDSLSFSRAKKEKVAREKFNMMKKSERAFKIEEK